MAESDQEVVSRRGPLAAIIFYIVCILLFPAMAIGYVFWVGKLYAKRTSGVSGTAQGPLSARWFQHRLGVRYDEPAHRLLLALPGISPLAVWLLFGPLQFAHRLSGYVPPTFRYPYEGDVTFSNQVSARQTFYDGVVDQYLPDIVQFVILGAGFDTRAYRLPRQWSVRAFEVDTPETLATKQKALKVADVDSAEVTFVAADFEKEDWFNRLVEAGFDADKPALFVWEGVTQYLDRTAVEDTLRKIAGCALGSVVAFDYFTTEVLESQSLHLRLVRASLQAGGEPLKFGIDSTPPSSRHLAELLQSCGLTLREQHILGKETAGERALGGYAIAVV